MLRESFWVVRVTMSPCALWDPPEQGKIGVKETTTAAGCRMTRWTERRVFYEHFPISWCISKAISARSRSNLMPILQLTLRQAQSVRSTPFFHHLLSSDSAHDSLAMTRFVWPSERLSGVTMGEVSQTVEWAGLYSKPSGVKVRALGRMWEA